ncbi:hypothetical protein VKT23_010397 [Stygiomarasmius scandens]|uniref:Uncharacterized protein n=1 Tax=Marasmiellus scandens TaxID=2682957 RepID=A0ABR1JCI2_9AGAR
MVSTPSPASMDEKKRKNTLERARVVHLSRQLQLRLQYARLKVEHGWHKQNLNEVENLYFHHSHLRAPKKDTETGGQSEPTARPSPPIPEVDDNDQKVHSQENGRSDIPNPSGTFNPSSNIAHSYPNFAAAAASSKTPAQPLESSVPSNPTSVPMDADQQRPSTPNNPVSLAAAAYPSPSYNPPPHFTNSHPTTSSRASVPPRTSLPSGPNSTSAPSSSVSSTSTYSWQSSQPSNLSLHPTHSSSSFSSTSSNQSRPPSNPSVSNAPTSYSHTHTHVTQHQPLNQNPNQLAPAATLTYDSFWSSHSAARSVRSSFSGFSGKPASATPVSGSLTSLSSLGSIGSVGSTGSVGSLGPAGAVSAALNLLQRRGSEGHFAPGTAHFDMGKAVSIGPGDVAVRNGPRVAGAERSSPAVGAVSVGRQ